MSDDWKATWDWAQEVWGEGVGFNRFFRTVASIIAEREEWEELGSSDVWHASYDCVKRARDKGITTQSELIDHVCDYQEVFGMEKAALMLVLMNEAA